MRSIKRYQVSRFVSRSALCFGTLLPALSAALLLSGCGESNARMSNNRETTARSAQPNAADEATSAASPATQARGEPSLRPRARVDTTEGAFVLELRADKAPIAVLNFLEYADSGFYEGTIFHRVMPTVLLQAGSYLPSLDKKTEGLRDGVFNEWGNGLTNAKYMVGAVREPGVSNSAKSEFYINLIDNPGLDQPRDGAGYTVFAEVVDGFDTLERIRYVPTETNPKYAGGTVPVVPVDPVVIKSVSLITPLDRPAANALANENLKSQAERVADVISALEAEYGVSAVRSETGLVTLDLEEGAGIRPLESDNVEIQYRGWLADGTEFEARLETPLVAKVETFYEGMREALLGMNEGGHRIAVIPPSLGIPGGIPGHVPSGATMFFELWLMQVKTGE